MAIQPDRANYVLLIQLATKLANCGILKCGIINCPKCQGYGEPNDSSPDVICDECGGAGEIIK